MSRAKFVDLDALPKAGDLVEVFSEGGDLEGRGVVKATGAQRWEGGRLFVSSVTVDLEDGRTLVRRPQRVRAFVGAS